MSDSNLSNHQFAILSIIRASEVRGKEIRDHLKKLKISKISKSGPAFYQLMSRMEEAGLVSSKFDQRIIDGQIIKEKKYKIKAKGARSLESTIDFNNRVTALHGKGILSHA